MGLDMYLFRKTYVRNWDHHKPEQRHTITVKKGGKKRQDIKPERIHSIVELVAEWRKANAIHAWFVRECQGGVDECQETYVEKKKLAELVDLCKQVLASVETVDGDVHTGTRHYPDGRVEVLTRPGQIVAQPGLASKLLPTKSGFFFGGTDYDDGYLRDIQDTIDQLESLLDDEEGSYYYKASW